ncbi:hypothetical protein M5K25_004578 [Dendrobium thyrsiflorum]|uniref:Peroxisomal membrane protein PEX14 n=1 Tax=Dendrobium thyrsiflorum TaxID=117978 RepID=A0ABD0VML9_DENTH
MKRNFSSQRANALLRISLGSILKQSLASKDVDPPPNASTPDSGTTNLATQPSTSPSLQTQAPIQRPQPASAEAGAFSLPPTFQQRRFNWSYALIAGGVLSASGAGFAILFKKAVLPRLKAWIRSVATEADPSEKEEKSSKTLAEETAEAAKAAVSAASLVATTKRKYFEAFMGRIDMQVKDMKTMNEVIRKLEKAREQDRLIEDSSHSATMNGTTNNSWITSQVRQTDTTPYQVKSTGTLVWAPKIRAPASARIFVILKGDGRSFNGMMFREIHQLAGLCSLRFATVTFGSGFRRSRVPVCELLHETLVQVSGGAVYQFFGRSRMKMSTSSSGIV